MLSIDLPKTPGIYKIFFNDPDLLYIGQSVNLRKRCQSHLQELRRGIHRNSHLQHAYDKYGSDAFHFEIVEYVEQRENLTEREQYYFDFLIPYYNICPIAETPPPWTPEKKQWLSQINKGKRMSDEARAKMSAAKKGRPGPRAGAKLTKEQRARMVGRQHSEESREKNRIAHLGKTPWNKGKSASMEARQKMSDAKKGKVTWNKGKVRTPEHSAKLSAAAKGRVPWNKGRKGLQVAWNKGKKASPESIAKMNKTRLATLAAKKAKKQAQGRASLWDDETAS